MQVQNFSFCKCKTLNLETEYLVLFVSAKAFPIRTVCVSNGQWLECQTFRLKTFWDVMFHGPCARGLCIFVAEWSRTRHMWAFVCVRHCQGLKEWKGWSSGCNNTLWLRLVVQLQYQDWSFRVKTHGVSFVGRKWHWRCFNIVTLLRHCMILLGSSLGMKTQDLVFDNPATVTLMSP